jgi:hypothetical protein
VDKVSGYPAHDGFPSRPEYFIDGTQSNISDPIHMMMKVCRGTFGLATPEDISSNNYDSKEYFKFKEADPVSTDGTNRWQQGIDTWISQQTDKDKYAPPEGYCRTGGLVTVNFDTPGDRSTVGSSFDVKFSTNSLVKVTEVKLWVDGNENKIWSEKPFEINLSLSDGAHTLKVKATDRDGNSQDKEIKIGVNTPWEGAPTPTITPIPTIISPTVGQT